MLCETVSVSEVYIGALGNELSSCTSVEDMITNMLSLVGLYKKRESRVESRASELHLPVNINKHVVGQAQIRLKVGEFWRSDDGEDSVLDPGALRKRSFHQTRSLLPRLLPTSRFLARVGDLTRQDRRLLWFHVVEG
jgi:hypothetical protein